MFINFIKYLMFLTLGIILGYFIFSTENTNNEPLIQIEPAVETAQFEQPKRSSPEKIIASTISQETLNKQDKLITRLRVQISDLQGELIKNAIAEVNPDNKLEVAAEEPTNKGIETLTMKDFESKMKSQFLDRFKGYAIELEGKRLDDIKEQFNNETDKADWNAEYETKITSYIQDNDPERFHFIDELTCNSNMCRLKVNSNEAASWQKLFLSMTQQSWYHSITLSENSGDPNVFIYYITQPRNI